MDILRQKAIKLGASDLKVSNVKGKRFQVKYNGKTINFGSSIGSTFIDHHNKDKRDAWYARHKMIQNKLGQYVITLKTSPSYWSHRLLWT
jgi:hypothetical protein